MEHRWNNCNANKLHEINDTFSPTLQIYADNRKEDVKLTRLRIGHSRLTHKHYLLNEDSPECIPCHRPLTVKHILIECIDTADIRRQYFNCADLQTLFKSVAGDTILAFLSDIHLIEKFKSFDWGVKSRMCPPYPQRDRKRRLNGAVCRNHRIKRVVPCRC